jgi:hypothetical protein
VERLLSRARQPSDAAVVHPEDQPIELYGVSWIDGATAGSSRVLGRFRLLDPSCTLFDDVASPDIVWYALTCLSCVIFIRNSYRFDLRSGIHALPKISRWRIQTLFSMLHTLFFVGYASVRIRHVFLTGDNEYLCIEAGIDGGMLSHCLFGTQSRPLGSTLCRCFCCCLPAKLFNYIPFLGHERTLQAASDLHARLERAQQQFSQFISDKNLNLLAADLAAIKVFQRAASANSGSFPLLALPGTSLPLDMLSLVVPMMHNLRRVCELSFCF